MSAPAIGLRSRWNPPRGKTTIDRSHPLAQGLLYCIHADGRNVVDLVSGRALTVQSGATSLPSAFGPAMRATSSGGGAYLPLTAAPAYPLSFTWAGTSLPSSGSGVGMLAFCYGVSGGWANEDSPYLYGLDRASTTASINPVSGSTFGSPVTWSTTAAVSVLTGTMQTGEQLLYGDGLRRATSSQALTAPTSTNLSGLGFCAYTLPGRSGDQRGSLGLVHNRILSPNEVAVLHADPFQIFRQ